MIGWVRRSVLQRIEADLRDKIGELEEKLYAVETERNTAILERGAARAIAQTLYREIRDQLANADEEADWIDDKTPNAELREVSKRFSDMAALVRKG